VTTPGLHIAQFNVARAKADVDHEIMAEFVADLSRINGLADGTRGFVWRLQTDKGDTIDIRPYEEDRLLLITLSVWESAEPLKRFVYSGEHGAVFARRHEWFEREDSRPSLVLWWVPADQVPTVAEGKERLEYLRSNGPSELAFSFGKIFPPPASLAALSEES
jgi:hypothetical protein